MIPFDCVEICDSKYSNLPKYGERSEIQKYFIRKSKVFGNSQAMNKISQNEQGRQGWTIGGINTGYTNCLCATDYHDHYFSIEKSLLQRFIRLMYPASV